MLDKKSIPEIWEYSDFSDFAYAIGLITIYSIRQTYRFFMFSGRMIKKFIDWIIYKFQKR